MEQEPLEELVSCTDRFFSLISALSDSTSRPRDYGTGKILNMVEVHTLAMIASTPGITPTQIAQNWNRTLSAASRNIDRLQRKGYVRKPQDHSPLPHRTGGGAGPAPRRVRCRHLPVCGRRPAGAALHGRAADLLHRVGELHSNC